MKTIEQIQSKKSKYIANRNARQAKNENLSAAQHQALAMLCTYRHKIHSHARDVAEGESHLSANCIQFIRNLMPVMLRQASLPAMELPIECFNRIDEAALEQINAKIEEYLQAIDESYGTQYAPKGYARKRVCA